MANAASAAFCVGCGRPLAASRCQRCSEPLPRRARFCPACGEKVEGPSTGAARAYTPRHLAEKILTTRSSLEGELKTVTVLFLDVTRSLEIAGQMSAEQWHGVLDRFFRILSAAVHRFDGTINQYTGDGIMALFGAPIAHEDHALLACRAALAIRKDLAPFADDLLRTHGVEFKVRTGMSTGEVVVGRIGDDLRMDYTAQAPVVGLAARLEAHAAPGQILAAENVATLAEGFFEWGEVERYEVRGFSEPVSARTLDGQGDALTRFERDVADGLTRLIGREAELEALLAHGDQVREGAGRIVSVVGEAGVGKTRLCHEFAKHARARGLGVVEARCLSYGRGVSYSLVLDLLRSYFAVAEGASPEAARNTIRKALGPQELLDEALPVLFELMGIADPELPAPRADAGTREAMLVGFLGRRLRSRAADTPRVLLIEDLQWTDDASEDLLAQLAQEWEGSGTLLVVNLRPEFEGEWLRNAEYERIDLRPLTPTHADRLLAELLGDDPSVVSLFHGLAERSAGNPLFVEESVRALRHSGDLVGEPGALRLVGDVDIDRVPSSIRALLEAQIDRLESNTKTVLQVAAVAGGEFSRALLEAVTPVRSVEIGGCLDALRAAGLIRDLPADGMLAFDHPLKHEVAYSSQLAARREQSHADIAGVLERAPTAADTGAAVVAHHWECAGRMLESAVALARAARWMASQRRSECVRLWRRVREQLQGLPRSPEADDLTLECTATLLGTGWREGVDAAEAESVFVQAHGIAQERGDVAWEALVRSSYARLLAVTRGADAYLEQAREAVRLAREHEMPAILMICETVECQALYYAGRLDEALERIDASLAGLVRPDLPISDMGFRFDHWLLNMRAMTLNLMGRGEQSRRALDTVLAEAEETDRNDLVEMAHTVYVDLCELRGDADGARWHAQRGLELATEHASPYSATTARAAVARAQLVSDAPSEAADLLLGVLAQAREGRVGLESEAMMLADLSEAYRRLGHLDAAKRAAEEACVVAGRRQQRALESVAQLALGRALAGRADSEDGAGRALERAIALASESGARVVEARARRERAALADRQGDGERQRTEAAAAAALELGMEPAGSASS